MKRSRSIALLSMGISALALAACEDKKAPVEAHVYNTVEECSAAGQLSQPECDHGFEAAIDVHEASATNFVDKDTCEEAEGKGRCERAPSGTDGERRYRPSMSAFLIPTGGHGQTQPLYRAPDGAGFRTAHNMPVAAKIGAVALSRETLARPPIRTAALSPAVARGGFGGTAASSAAHTASG